MITNKIIISMAVLMLAACASPRHDQQAAPALKEQRLATDFTDEGIKVYYTLMGKLEKIEIHGQADAWKGNVETIAEADALAKLVKFIYGNEVATERKVKLMGRAIEDAEDIVQRNASASTETIASNDKQLEEEIRADKAPGANTQSAQRKAKILNETLTETVTTMTAKGRLTGVRKVSDYRRNDGKLYVAVYQWSEKDQAASESVRERMNKKPE